MQPDLDAIERPGDPSWPRIGRLKRRAEFLRVGKGRRWHGVAMSIQSRARSDEPDAGGGCRFGFTLTKKVGNAVVRNRARRRLREAVRLASAALPVEPGHDYVIVGRIDALRLPFAALRAELVRGVAAAERGGRPAGGRRSRTNNEAAPARTAPERIRPRP